MQLVFLLEQVVNGLVLGGYYLLIALGLSLIFSVGGIVNLASRRCQIIKLSRSGAVLQISTKFKLPKNFYLDIVSARIPMIGCLALRVHANDTVEARFLRLLAEKDMNRIFVYSTHPNHRDRTLDIYS